MNNRSAAVVLATPADGHDPAENQPALVFIREENRYQLSQIWESSTEGLALPAESAAPKHERAKVVLTDGLEAKLK